MSRAGRGPTRARQRELIDQLQRAQRRADTARAALLTASADRFVSAAALRRTLNALRTELATLETGLAELAGPALSTPDGPAPGSTGTSRRAAALVAPRVGTLQRRVLGLIERAVIVERTGGLTDPELLTCLPELGPNSVRPRRVELLHAGWLVDSGHRRVAGHGAEHTVWTLSPAARAVLGVGAEE